MIFQAFNKWLTFDIIYQHWVLMAMHSYNMISYYDRFLQPVASFCLQIMGFLEPAVVPTFTFLLLIRHHIQIVYRDS